MGQTPEAHRVGGGWLPGQRTPSGERSRCESGEVTTSRQRFIWCGEMAQRVGVGTLSLVQIQAGSSSGRFSQGTRKGCSDGLGRFHPLRYERWAVGRSRGVLVSRVQVPSPWRSGVAQSGRAEARKGCPLATFIHCRTRTKRVGVGALPLLMGRTRVRIPSGPKGSVAQRLERQTASAVFIRFTEAEGSGRRRCVTMGSVMVVRIHPRELCTTPRGSSNGRTRGKSRIVDHSSGPLTERKGAPP